MGGRGRGRGGGGGGSTTVRAVATALGIARHEMGQFQKEVKLEAPPTYPVRKGAPLPLEMTDELLYQSKLKLELLQRFHESPFNLDHHEKSDVKRYTDKYAEAERVTLNPNFSRLPEELCWVRAKDKRASKKRKITDDDAIKARLAKLEKKELAGDNVDEEPKEEEEDEGSEHSERVEDEQAAGSDEDNVEEDNDYITSYFDNGEGYGDGGSDDNMDGDEY